MTASRLQQSRPGSAAPDFRHVRHWIFDLDNTLYRGDCGLFAQIESRMTDFVATLTGTEHGEAKHLQKELYRQYGTTLCGLMATRGIDPEAYLAFVHDIDLSSLQADQALALAVARLPGKRYVFTNACRHHAQRILSALGLAHLFDAVWDIRSIGFIPKPDRRAYEAVVAQAGLAADQAAMFDDIAHNLVAARALGMTTIWLRTGGDHGPHGSEISLAEQRHIDHETGDLTAFLNGIGV